MIKLGSQDRILLISLQGIGNTLFLEPLVRSFKDSYPEVRITLLVRKKFISDVLYSPDLIEDTVVLGDPSFSNIFHSLAVVFRLRKRRYALSLLAFPSNKYLFNLVSFLCGARFRIAHCYEKKNLCSLNFLNTHKVRLRRAHDYFQNFALLEPLGISSSAFQKPSLLWNSSGVRPVKSRMTSRPVIGIHPGSSRDRAMKEKRWPQDRFQEIIRRIRERFPHWGIHLYFGPDEKDLETGFRSLQGRDVRLISELSLPQTISQIGQCSLFLSNDSGLMNIAAALGKKVVSIAGGPTDPVRTYPFGEKNAVLFSSVHCYPCRGLKRLGQKFKCIYPQRSCLLEITADRVWQILLQYLK